MKKVNLYRRYMDSSKIENSNKGEYSGQYDCWTLDLSNTNSKEFEFMEDLGIIKYKYK